MHIGSDRLVLSVFFFFFFNDTATTEIYTLSLHDALPILGWKDTVRMNPLEDILVALQPITPPTPWPVPNSVRTNDVTGMGNMFSNLDPFSNAGAVTVDGPTKFGWEYVW